MIHPSLRRTFVLVFMLFCGQVLGQNLTSSGDAVQEKEHVLSSYLNEEAKARGYTSLVLNYPFVQQRMVRDIQNGKSQNWVSWLNAGTKQNYSLYWWMLAQWHESTGSKGKAYSVAVQAMVFSKIELQSCQGRDSDKTKVNNQLMTLHKSIVTYKPTQDEIRTSVLEAIGRAESQLDQGNPLSGQSCFRLYTVKGNIPPDLNKKWQKRGSNMGVLQRQRNALRLIKKELSYQKIVQTSTIEQIWKKDEIYKHTSP